MRERNVRGLRQGPKLPIPGVCSPHLTIDSKKNLNGHNRLPLHKRFVDPWDMENYNYVRKKTEPSPRCYDSSTSPSPAGEPVPTQYFYMPREDILYKKPKYRGFRDEEEVRLACNDYRECCYCSSIEGTSSCEDESIPTLKYHNALYGTVPPREERLHPMYERDIEYNSSPYDYCDTFAIDRCDYPVPECYECLSQNQSSQLYSSLPSSFDSSLYGSTIGGRSNSIYSNTYASRFGLSKKGLLQIDYSCSWDDLDRVIGKSYLVHI